MDFLGIFKETPWIEIGFLFRIPRDLFWLFGAVLAICAIGSRKTPFISIGPRGWENQLIGPHYKDSVIKGGMSLSPKKRDF